ncbi:two-partner secretion domain-containing protein [Pseudomonas sp. St29]|uniref:two-partner secretion domain-containing protein n=1 Tax=Pseudomonas sp. St29 TaxID=1500687 RepID=UPI0005FC8400|nr:filamentous hemagglutinin N-terminal domain-containing protein [Pseudomonas sp. St29]BAQ78055.1 filamentous hemagglutinin, intein-containing [Pseudomonas sp. St29]
MDVRQLAFLARQPSAALQPRDTFWGLSKRGLAFILANMMFWQPVVAMADGIVVNGSGTNLGQAGNGVPIVNIAAPNGSGLSHNQFSDYNVGQQGVILNNAVNRTQQTQLGGIILGNPNLGGRAANVILNEVNGGSPSQLKGYTEVAGQSAHVIVANPYGVTCNGCGFINTPKATLTTGKPVIENGQLQRYQVDQGSVAIEGAGLNASNIDQFEIITRSAKINAEIQAKHLAVIAGANDVDAKTLNATSRTANPADAPQLAIDSSALGGMYAGAIKLVGTEAGVGVKLDGKLIASGGDIQLDANGQLRIAEATTSGEVIAKAQSLETSGPIYAGSRIEMSTSGAQVHHQSLAARDSIALTSGGILTNNGIVEAGVNLDNTRNTEGDLRVQAKSLNNRGKTLIASRNLTVSTMGNLDNQSGTLSAQDTLKVTAQNLDNRSTGSLISQGQLEVTVEQVLDNRDQGVIASNGLQQIAAATLRNTQGVISSESSLNIDTGSIDNQTGRVVAEKDITLKGLMLENTQGNITSKGDISLTLGTLKQQGGKLISQGRLVLVADSLDNRNNGYIAAAKAMSLTLSDTLSNASKGMISSQGTLKVKAVNIDNSQASLLSQGDLILDLDNDLKNLGGSVIAQAGSLDVLHARHIDNRGGVLASVASWIKTQLSGVLNNGMLPDDSGKGGLIQGQSAKIESTHSLLNEGGQISALVGNTDIVSGDIRNLGGSLLAKQFLSLRGNNLDNSNNGRIAAQQVDFGLSGTLSNQHGLVESSSSLIIDALALNNQNGKLRSLGTQGTTELKFKQLLDNQGGTIETANADLILDMADFTNAAGAIRHLGNGSLGLAIARFSNVGGNLLSQGSFKVTADSWSNNSAIQAANFDIDVTSFTQLAGGTLNAGKSFNAKGVNWNNAGILASDGSLKVLLSGAYTGSGQSQVSSVGQFDFNAASIDLGSGARLSGGTLSNIGSSGALTNAGRITGAGDLKVHADLLINRGTLGGNGGTQVQAGILSNNRGLIFSGQDLTLQADVFTNLYADVFSLGALNISARDGIKRNVWLENISGTMESSGDMSLHTASLINRKDIFSTIDEQVSGSISVKCYDCSGDHHNVDYIATETFRSLVKEDSTQGLIQSGANLTVEADTVLNQYSVMAAGSDLKITAETLTNQGATSGETTRVRTWNTGRITDGTDNRFRANYIYPYNAQALPKVLPVNALNAFKPVGDITVVNPGALLSAAVIQAGGSVTIQALQTLINSSVVEFQIPMAGAQKSATADSGPRTQPVVVQLNPQLPPDLAQQQINPTDLPGFTLPTGDNGLFRVVDSQDAAQSSTEQGLVKVKGSTANWTGRSHKYLIETNSALTDLRQFMSSDYLLSNLGYDPQTSWKRLGDGLYEQRLIQQALIARTGQRFIAGQTSDEGLFKYLMNNAIASKQQLDLSLGVSLTSQQVAALTHDIVWMEDQVVNGEHVLVPVLYLAQVNNRLTADGALIQGKDVTLIAGTDLSNTGTLRASESLKVSAGKDLLNARLMDAGKQLEVLAGTDLINAQGGILKGQDVSLTSLSGNVHNDRSITTVITSGPGFSQATSVVDNAARIESGNNVNINAAKDVQNIGGAISAAGNTTIRAGKDVIIAAAEENNGMTRQDKRHSWSQSETVQHASEINSAGDLLIDASDDLSVVASHLDAVGNINLNAGNDVLLTSAANEEASAYRYKGGGKKVRQEEQNISQQASTVIAGGDVKVSAGNDLTLISSKVDAGDEAYLVAGDQLNLLAQQDVDYSLYDMKKKGSWGGKKTRRDEVTDMTHVGSEISSGGDLTLKSGGDQTYQAASLTSGNDLTLDSGGAITFEGMKDLHQESHEKSSSSLAWTSAKGKGNTDETLRQTALVAQGKVAIKALDGLKIDINHIDQRSISQSIDAMVKADPQLAWLKEAEQRGDVDWRKVQEIHDSFKYSHSSLGQGAMLAIVIVVAAFTAGAASGAIGSAAGASAGSGSAMAAAGNAAMVQAGTAVGTAAAGWGNAMVTTALSSMAGTAAASTINNKGNLGKVVKEVFSEDSLKGYATGAVIAGFGAAFTNEMGRTLSADGNYVYGDDYAGRLKAYAANTALKGALSGKDRDTWLSIAATGALMELYQYSAGREPDARPGVDRPGGPVFTPSEGGLVPQELKDGVIREGKNIGLNRELGCASFYSICHGTPISNGLNKVPGFNAFATLHDTWMINPKDFNAPMSFSENIGTMPPALIVNYGALYDKYRHLIEVDKKHDKK